LFPDVSTETAGERKLSSKVQKAVFSLPSNICYCENEVLVPELLADSVSTAQGL
jgi:hypothetical protein